MVDNCDKISCFHEQKRNLRFNISKVSVGEETSCLIILIFILSSSTNNDTYGLFHTQPHNSLLR